MWAISDFTYIKDFYKNLVTCQNLHEISVDWIKTQLTLATKPVILLTHFGMLTLQSKKFPGSVLNNYFLTGALDGLIIKPTLLLHGHTHECYTVSTNCYSLVCNPYGYGSENRFYTPNRVLKLNQDGVITI